jgi:hypothetical protein
MTVGEAHMVAAQYTLCFKQSVLSHRQADVLFVTLFAEILSVLA